MEASAFVNTKPKTCGELLLHLDHRDELINSRPITWHFCGVKNFHLVATVAWASFQSSLFYYPWSYLSKARDDRFYVQCKHTPKALVRLLPSVGRWSLMTGANFKQELTYTKRPWSQFLLPQRWTRRRVKELCLTDSAMKWTFGEVYNSEHCENLVWYYSFISNGYLSRAGNQKIRIYFISSNTFFWCTIFKNML